MSGRAPAQLMPFVEHCSFCCKGSREPVGHGFSLAVREGGTPLYENPNSGRRGRKRDAELNHAIGVIQSAGVRTTMAACRVAGQVNLALQRALAGGFSPTY
jgi:hypothetical protein